MLLLRLEMRESFLFGAASLIALLLGGISIAAPTGVPIPPSLLGEWVVTKVYELNKVYPQPSAEPKIWLDGKTLVIEQNRLSLGGEICLDLDVQRKRGSIAQILKETAGETAKEIGLKSRKGVSDYFVARCNSSFSEEKFERIGVNYIEWYLVMNRADQDEIELAFFNGAYMELHRASPTS